MRFLEEARHANEIAADYARQIESAREATEQAVERTRIEALAREQAEQRLRRALDELNALEASFASIMLETRQQFFGSVSEGVPQRATPSPAVQRSPARKSGPEWVRTGTPPPARPAARRARVSLSPSLLNNIRNSPSWGVKTHGPSIDENNSSGVSLKTVRESASRTVGRFKRRAVRVRTLVATVMP